MTIQEAIRTLDEVIPSPDNKMVDGEHMKIAIAWKTIRDTLLFQRRKTKGCLTARTEHTKSEGDKICLAVNSDWKGTIISITDKVAKVLNDDGYTYTVPVEDLMSRK